jgi:hypothetical protein
VRRAKAAFLSGCKSHPAILLQPEAIGAVMELAKWLKPLVEHKLHAIPECQLTVEPAVHWFSTYDRSWPFTAD